jgi:ELWxxDGT repeat protein
MYKFRIPLRLLCMLLLSGFAMVSPGQEISMIDLNHSRVPRDYLQDFSYILKDKLYYGNTITYEFDGVNPARTAYELGYQYKGYVINDEVFITARNSNNDNYAIWRYNGTKSPVKLVDFNSVAVPTWLTQVNKNLYFFVCDSTKTNRLWVIDSANNSHSVCVISTGHYDSVPGDLRFLNNKLYYTLGNKSLWEYDQKNAPRKIIEFGAGYYDNLINFNNRLYFTVYDTVYGSELWAYDGINPPGLAFDIREGNESSFPQSFAILDNKLFFNTNIDLQGYQIWEYDGISPPLLSEEFVQGGEVSDPYIIKVINDKLYFTFDFEGYRNHVLELWIYDGSASPYKISAHQTSGYYFLMEFKGKVYYNTHQPHIDGSAFMCDGINPPEYAWLGLTDGSKPYSLNVFKDKLRFIAEDGIHGRSLWECDGKNAPVIAADIPGDTSLSEYARIVQADNKLFIVDTKKIIAFKGEDTLVKKDIDESEIYPLLVNNDKLYYSSGGVNSLSLKVFDGLNDPVVLASNASSISADEIVSFHDKIYFKAHDADHGVELWVLNEDNTETMVADLVEGEFSSNPGSFMVFHDRLFFVTENIHYKNDLWVLDGSGMPSKVNTGLNVDQISNLCVFKDRLYFVIGTYPVGQLWSYDGSGSISLVFPETITSDYHDNHKMVFLENGKMYIISQYERGYFGESKYRLWEYDGNKPPKMIIDFNHLSYSKPGNFNFVKNNLYFGYSNLWEFDGINPPVPLKGKNNDFFGTDPASFTEFKGKMYFTADQPGSGRELFALTLPDSMMNVRACNYFDFNGSCLTHSGIYYDTVPDAAGSDSIIRLNLIVNRSTSSTIIASVCDEYGSPSGKYLWKSSGTYHDTITNAAGCDSMITIHLTVNFNTAKSIHVTACQKYISPSGRYTWNESGTYNDTIPNDTGCDSIITISLTINHLNNTVTVAGSGLQVVYGGGQYQWVNCLQGDVPVSGAVYQSFTPLSPGTYAVIINDKGCVDTSDCYAVMANDLPENESRSGITLYPNPTTGNFTIDLGKVYSEALITLTSSDGQIIRRERAKNSREIEMEMDEPAGIYLVKVLVEGRDTIFRVVKR